MIKPDVLSLPLDKVLLLSQEKFHPNIPCLFSTSLIVHANSSSDATRYHNRSLANTLNCAKRSISASLTEKPLTMITSLLVSPTSRRHSTRKKTPLLCAECSGVPILVFRPFVAHLLYGVPLAMSLVSCLFMELVLRLTVRSNVKPKCGNNSFESLHVSCSSEFCLSLYRLHSSSTTCHIRLVTA